MSGATVSEKPYKPGRLAEEYKGATGRTELTSEEIGFLVVVEQELFRCHSAIKTVADDVDKLRKELTAVSGRAEFAARQHDRY